MATQKGRRRTIRWGELPRDSSFSAMRFSWMGARASLNLLSFHLHHCYFIELYHFCHRDRGESRRWEEAAMPARLQWKCSPSSNEPWCYAYAILILLMQKGGEAASLQYSIDRTARESDEHQGDGDMDRRTKFRSWTPFSLIPATSAPNSIQKLSK